MNYKAIITIKAVFSMMAVFLLSFQLHSQAMVKGSGIRYYEGYTLATYSTAIAPDISVGTEFAYFIDVEIVCKWDRVNNKWVPTDNILSQSGVPVHTPSTGDPFSYLDKDTGNLYKWGGASWSLIGTGGGSTTVSSITNVQDTSLLTPVTGDEFVNSAKDTSGVYSVDRWLLRFGGGGAWDHIATQSIDLDTFWLSPDGTSKGLQLPASGGYIYESLVNATYRQQTTLNSTTLTTGIIDDSFLSSQISFFKDATNPRLDFNFNAVSNWRIFKDHMGIIPPTTDPVDVTFGDDYLYFYPLRTGAAGTGVLKYRDGTSGTEKTVATIDQLGGQQTTYNMPDNGLHRGPFLEEINQYVTDSTITLQEGDVIRYTQDSVIFHSRDTILNNSSYNAFPAFAVTKTGKLIIGYMAAAEHGVKNSPIAMRSSKDGGKTWSEPDTLFSTSVLKERGNIHDIFVAENNDIYTHISYQDSTITAEYNTIILKSTDDAETWSTIDTLPDFGGVGTFVTSFIVLPNGDWVVGYYITSFSAGYAWSSDEGETWTNALYSSQAGLNLNEQLIRPISRDTLLAIIRGEVGNVLYYSKSGDGGRSWSPVSNTGLTGQKRCFPWWSKLSTGEIYLTSRELAGDTEHYRIAISEDNADTWSNWLEVDSTNSLMYGAFQEVSPGNLFGVYAIEYSSTNTDLYFHRMSSLKKPVTLEYTYLSGELVQTGFDFEQPFEDNINPSLVARQFSVDTIIDLSRHSVITLNERTNTSLSFSNIQPGILRALHVIDSDSTNTVFADSIYCYSADQKKHVDAIRSNYAGTLFSDQDTALYLTPCPPDYDYIPASITPATYSPFAWYDAGRETYSNGATVDTIRDQSGNDRHLISAGSAEPIFETNSFAGESSYHFNATTDYATTSNSSGQWDFMHDDESTVFIIAQIGNVADPDALMMMFGPTSTAKSGVFLGLDDRSGSSRNEALFIGGLRGSGGTQNFQMIEVDSLSPNVFNYIQWKADADNGTAGNRILVSLNEGPEFGTNTATSDPSTSGTYATFRLNGDDTGAFGTIMKICEIVVYDSILSPAQIVNLRRDYFGPKYNLTIE